MRRFGSERGGTQPGAAGTEGPERAATGTRRRVGFFAHLNVGDKHIGAILVTNQIAVPIEFKYTEPVTATRLHKVLYGAALDRYLRETVIRDRLGAEIRTDPEFFLTNFEEREFLGPLSGKEMIALERAGTSGAPPSEPFTRVRDREAVVALEEGPALRLAFSTTDGPAQLRLANSLQELARTMDLLEPFERIKSALTILCGEEKRAAR